jgi:hypothetical protein
MKSSSILRRILEGPASRPVSPEDSEAVKTLKLRLAAASAPTPEEMGRAVQPTQYAHQIPVRPRLPLAKSLRVTAEELRDLRDLRDESPQDLQEFIKVQLAERAALATIANPAACAAAVTLQAHLQEALGPQTMRHIEHLERQVKMAEMRLKETRQQLAEKAAQFGEAVVAVALMEERYEELEYSEIAEWVEENVFPRLREVLGMPAGEKGGAL